MKQAWIVFAKELADALRDRRTLLRILIPAVLMGPLLLMALSGMIASFEAQAEKRAVHVHGRENGPTLINFIKRQSYMVVGTKDEETREGYEKLLRDGKATAPLLVIPKDFETQLLTGEAPVSAGTFTPDASGRVSTATDTPSQIPRPVIGAQVTIEPAAGAASPSGAVVLSRALL